MFIINMKFLFIKNFELKIYTVKCFLNLLTIAVRNSDAFEENDDGENNTRRRVMIQQFKHIYPSLPKYLKTVSQIHKVLTTHVNKLQS